MMTNYNEDEFKKAIDRILPNFDVTAVEPSDFDTVKVSSNNPLLCETLRALGFTYELKTELFGDRVFTHIVFNMIWKKAKFLPSKKVVVEIDGVGEVLKETAFLVTFKGLPIFKRYNRDEVTED
jgi:hypothetical protein